MSEQPIAMTATDRFALGIARILVFLRWPVVLLGIASVVAAGYGGQFLSFSNNLFNDSAIGIHGFINNVLPEMERNC